MTARRYHGPVVVGAAVDGGAVDGGAVDDGGADVVGVAVVAGTSVVVGAGPLDTMTVTVSPEARYEPPSGEVPMTSPSLTVLLDSER